MRDARQPLDGRRALVVAAVALVLLAGCASGPVDSGGDGTTPAPTTTAPTTPAPTTTAPTTVAPTTTTPTSTAPTTDPSPGDYPSNGTANGTAWAAVAVDASPYGSSVLEGGVAHPPEHGTTSRYATVIAGEDGLDAVNLTLLESVDSDAAAFVEETNLSSASLLAFQEAPHSSVPDYRVRGLSWSGSGDEPATLWVTDESDAGTDDVTAETLFVRIQHPDGVAPGAAPDGIVVHAGENVTVEGS